MAEEKETLIPTEVLNTELSKVQELLRSRRFWAVVLAVTAAIAVNFFGFEPAQAERFNQVLLTVVSVYIGGISLEEAAKKLGAGSLVPAQLSSVLAELTQSDK